jgi:hypothetical protein
MEIVAAVVGYLLEGAFQYVGGALMSSALGGATITDVHTWIREAVVELEAFVAAKLDQLVLQQLAGDMDQAKANIQEYASLKPRERSKNRYLIEFADTHARSLISISLNYRQSFFVSLAAMAYWSFARYALYADDHATAHIRTMKGDVDEFLIKASETFQYLLDRQSPDYRIKVVCDVDPGLPGQDDVPPEPGYYYCWVTLDGHDVGGDVQDPNDEARAQRQAQAYADRQIRPAVEKDFQQFKANGKKSLKLIADTYDRMCRHVGGSYTPPPNLPFNITIVEGADADTATVEAVAPPHLQTLLMPGAIVIGREQGKVSE